MADFVSTRSSAGRFKTLCCWPVIRHMITSIGQPIGEMDMMIAAHAAAIGAVLVSNNLRHFARLAGRLDVVNWLD